MQIDTVDKWNKQYKKQGHIDLNTVGGSKGKINNEKLKLEVENNSDILKLSKEFKVNMSAISQMFKN